METFERTEIRRWRFWKKKDFLILERFALGELLLLNCSVFGGSIVVSDGASGPTARGSIPGIPNLLFQRKIVNVSEVHDSMALLHGAVDSRGLIILIEPIK